MSFAQAILDPPARRRRHQAHRAPRVLAAGGARREDHGQERPEAADDLQRERHAPGRNSARRSSIPANCLPVAEVRTRPLMLQRTE